MLFAAIYVPDFPVASIVRLESELREHAVAVIEGTPPAVRVIAANDKASEAGIEPGMTKLEAEERLAACNGRLAVRSPQREAAAHAALLDCACGFSPRVEDTSADTAVLDLAGLERMFGPAASMARELAARCARTGMEANVAVAANPDAAVHAARGFAGVTVIPRGHEAERLASLPVDVLAALPDPQQCQEMLDTLERWGVRTLRALAALPEVAVTERLGQPGLLWQRLARGATMRALHVTEPPLIFEETFELEYPVELLEPLAFVLHRMLEQLCARLSARALATNELRIRLNLEASDDCGIAELRNYRIHERALRLPVPMLDAKIFLKLLQLDLQAHPPKAPVVKVWLAAEPAEPRRTQNGLFLPASPEPERLELTLARIAGVVGRGEPIPGADREPRVGSAEILDTYRPDAFRMNKFSPPAAREHEPSLPSASNAADHACPPATALRRFRPPLVARVTVCEGRLARLAAECANGEIGWAAGPWRVSGEWWTDHSWSREEWDVSVGGALYRIYRDANGWWVEGTYD